MTKAKNEYTYGSHDPIGYSKVAFRKAYQRQCAYGWFAAAVRIGETPDEYGYVKECMDQYHMLKDTIDTQDIDAVRELGYDIINEKRREIRAMSKGRLHDRRQPDGTRRVETFFEYTLDTPAPSEHGDTYETVGTRLPDYERGYDEIDDASVMDERLAILAKALHPDDYAAVLLVVNGDFDSFRGACLSLGHTPSPQVYMRTRMRQHASVVRGFDAFA